MVASSFYHSLINLLIPGFLSFKRGRYLKGTALMVSFFAGIDFVLLGLTGFIDQILALSIGIALIILSWLYAQWGCFRGLLRSTSEKSQLELKHLYTQGIQSFLKGDLDSAGLAFKNCRHIDPFSVSAQFLSGVVNLETNKKATRFFEQANDMSQDRTWHWFVERMRTKSSQ